jgi:hypothetical protein
MIYNMDLVKSHWIADENHVSLSVPIAKVDKENRLVSGFATLDNIDTSDDVVTAEASKAAFDAFRGNIREMHQPIAAGRLVDFKEDEFFHKGEFYRGIFATAYVSKGAEDTWQKVLDGTLSGFSIGGNITDQETKFVKDAGEHGKTIRFIKAYDLSELSLVDNPANQLANIFSIVKNQEGSFMKGMVAETTIVNVFWCPTDEIAKNSTGAAEQCLSCGKAMEQIGWFEKGEDDAVKTASTVSTFLRQKEATVNTDNGEGGVTMSDEVTKSVEDDKDKAPAVQAEAAEKADEGAGVVTSESLASDDDKEDADEAKSEEVVEEAPVEPDFEKMFDDLKGSVKESIESHVSAVEEKVAKATEAFETKATEFEKGLNDLKTELEAVRETREDVSKRLDALESATAIKKSGEVESEPVTKSKTGLWGGTFFDGV